MSEMEDPIFDPWCVDHEHGARPPQRTSRWRVSPLAGQGVPATRPVPKPVRSKAFAPPQAEMPAAQADSVPERAVRSTPPPPLPPIMPSRPMATIDPRDAPGRSDPEEDLPFVPTPIARPAGDSATPPSAPRPAQDEPDDPALDFVPQHFASDYEAASSEREADLPTSADGLVETPRQPTPPRQSPPTPRPLAPAAGGAATFLKSVLVPRIEALNQRLTMARHRTTVDDRLDQSPASFRLQVHPWRGPFDESDEVKGPVLEVVLESDLDGTVIGRFWLDPLSETPSAQSRVSFEKLTDEWIDQLLLDFVEKALRSG